MIDKDLSTIPVNDLGGIKSENKIPDWLKPAMDPGNRGVLLFLREFHGASDKVKSDVLNILIKKEVQSFKFGPKTLVVVGVLAEDESAESITHTHTVRFYKK